MIGLICCALTWFGKNTALWLRWWWFPSNVCVLDFHRHRFSNRLVKNHHLRLFSVFSLRKASECVSDNRFRSCCNVASCSRDQNDRSTPSVGCFMCRVLLLLLSGIMRVDSSNTYQPIHSLSKMSTAIKHQPFLIGNTSITRVDFYLLFYFTGV